MSPNEGETREMEAKKEEEEKSKSDVIISKKSGNCNHPPTIACPHSSSDIA
jgi:hypothetical protein